VTPTDDLNVVTRALEIVRRWWLLVVLASAAMGFVVATAIGVDRVDSRLTNIEFRVDKMEGLNSRLDRIEGMLRVLVPAYREPLP
jgi:hypothetical protein